MRTRTPRSSLPSQPADSATALDAAQSTVVPTPAASGAVAAVDVDTRTVLTVRADGAPAALEISSTTTTAIPTPPPMSVDDVRFDFSSRERDSAESRSSPGLARLEGLRARVNARRAGKRRRQRDHEAALEDMGAGVFFDRVKERSHLFRGAAYGTMMRNDAFRFLRIGTFLERADNTARLLDFKYMRAGNHGGSLSAADY